MLKSVFVAIQKQFADTGDDQDANHENALRLATAALLVEMGRADHYGDGDESTLILELLRENFEMESEDVGALYEFATEKADQVVSLHELTSLLHRSLNDEERGRLLEMMWRVAYADKRLDPLEDSLVRKVADLLYVRNTSLMKIRDRVLSNIDQ
ncbi:MAG: TerB family tellurite resistance protein [Gammaproteobacteria bacterium]|nr:TerB family tellurite resistance protein [Gammaproteobacteria bacterium]MCZ6717413.1 TerB family tellurite resistance protein [Gammaproteobacteria bacterium]